MELRHLRYFVTVAEERHFGRAAERLHMAQPPLSQQIQRLEAELDVRLLHRTTRRVELTTAGESFLLRARAILRSADEAADEARRIAAGSIGHLTIGCVGSATYSLLPAISRQLSEELPGVDFAFRGELLAPAQIEALRSAEIDVALLRPPVTDGSLTVRPLRDDRLVVAAPAGHRLATKAEVTVTDLRDVDLIVHSAERRSVMYDVVLRLCREAGFDPRIRYEVAETSTLVTLVAGGLGVAIVPEPVRAHALEGVVYLPLARPTVTLQLAIAHRASRDEPHLLRTVEIIERTVRGLSR